MGTCMPCESFKMRIAQTMFAQRGDGLDQIVQAGAEATTAAALEDREYFELAKLASIVFSVAPHDERKGRDKRTLFGWATQPAVQPARCVGTHEHRRFARRIQARRA